MRRTNQRKAEAHTIKVAVLPWVAKVMAAELATQPTIKEGSLIAGALTHLPFCYAPELFVQHSQEIEPMLADRVVGKRLTILTINMSDDVRRHYQRWNAVEVASLGTFFTAQARDRLYTYIDAAHTFGVSQQKAVDAFYRKYEIEEDELPQDSMLRQYRRRNDRLRATG